MNDKSLLDLLKFCEQQEIEVIFWYRPEEVAIGVPKYVGFNIDVGEMFEVTRKSEGGLVLRRSVALHDFRSIIISNPDNFYVQEHQTTGVHLHD